MPVVSTAELSRRRHDILEGARRCFADHGYEGATVRRLEEATGKSRGAIFHHFQDKENLFLALARDDAATMADIVAREGLVEVMRDLLDHPEKHGWFATRLEIASMIRTDPAFREKWQAHQAVLDQAVHERLTHNAQQGRMRTDVPVDVLQTYLETVMDGLLMRLGSGQDTDGLRAVLDLVEQSVRDGRGV